MMKIKRFVFNPFQENTYLVDEKGNKTKLPKKKK